MFNLKTWAEPRRALAGGHPNWGGAQAAQPAKTGYRLRFVQQVKRMMYLRHHVVTYRRQVVGQGHGS